MPVPDFVTLPDHVTIPANPPKWAARKNMGRRIKADEVRARGWERQPEWVGRPGKGLTPFVKDDPRVEHADCTHGQIKDLNGAPGPISRCLDCGGLIHTAKRELVDEPDVVDDETLDDLRQQWNSAHWGL